MEPMTWFGRAASADVEGETDADERLSELDGLVLTDLLEGEDDVEFDDDIEDDEDEDEQEYQGEDEELDEQEYQGESTPDRP